MPGDPADLRRMAGKSANGFSRLGFPNLDLPGSIFLQLGIVDAAAGRDQFAVGTEGGSVDSRLMFHRGQRHFPSRSRVPQLDGGVADGGQLSPVGAESHATDDIGMAPQDIGLLAVTVINANSVVTCRRVVSSVGRDRDCPD